MGRLWDRFTSWVNSLPWVDQNYLDGQREVSRADWLAAAFRTGRVDSGMLPHLRDNFGGGGGSGGGWGDHHPTAYPSTRRGDAAEPDDRADDGADDERDDDRDDGSGEDTATEDTGGDGFGTDQWGGRDWGSYERTPPPGHPEREPDGNDLYGNLWYWSPGMRDGTADAADAVADARDAVADRTESDPADDYADTADTTAADTAAETADVGGRTR